MLFGIQLRFKEAFSFFSPFFRAIRHSGSRLKWDDRQVCLSTGPRIIAPPSEVPIDPEVAVDATGVTSQPTASTSEAPETAKIAHLRHLLSCRSTEVDHPVAVRNIELTNRCPLRCVMCPRTYDMDRDQGLMDFDTYKRVIDEYVAVNPTAAATTTLDLHHFGDSLMHPQYGKFARYATQAGVFTTDSINPILLKDRVIDQIFNGEGDALRQLWVSIDGHDNDTFQQIRGLPNAYDRSVENLERFLARKVTSGSNMKVYVTVVNFIKNEGSMQVIRDKWERHPGVDGFIEKGYVTFDGSVDAVNQHSMTHDSLRVEGAVWCNDPWTYVTIAWNGDVLPCCNDYNAKYVLGNVKQQTLTEIWTSAKMKALRAEFITGRVSNPLCRNCEKTKYPRSGDPGLAALISSAVA